MTFLLGLTGSIATGKSTALGFFARHGIKTYSADMAVHELYKQEAAPAVAALFPGTLTGGAVDRAKLAQALLADPDRIRDLEAVIHPMVRKKVDHFLSDLDPQADRLAVLEIPLLFETANRYPLDAIAVTVVNEEEQRRRALARPGMTVEKLQTILARQLPQAEKRARADFVIDTSTGLADTERQVMDIISECRGRQEKEQGG